MGSERDDRQAAFRQAPEAELNRLREDNDGLQFIIRSMEAERDEWQRRAEAAEARAERAATPPGEDFAWSRCHARLAAERDALREENNRLWIGKPNMVELLTELRDALDAAELERDQARAAAEDYLDACDGMEGSCEDAEARAVDAEGLRAMAAQAAETAQEVIDKMREKLAAAEARAEKWKDLVYAVAEAIGRLNDEEALVDIKSLLGLQGGGDGR